MSTIKTSKTMQTQDPATLKIEAIKRYAKLRTQDPKTWTDDDLLFVNNYQAYLSWQTNGKGCIS